MPSQQIRIFVLESDTFAFLLVFSSFCYRTKTHRTKTPQLASLNLKIIRNCTVKVLYYGQNSDHCPLPTIIQAQLELPDYSAHIVFR